MAGRVPPRRKHIPVDFSNAWWLRLARRYDRARSRLAAECPRTAPRARAPCRGRVSPLTHFYNHHRGEPAPINLGPGDWHRLRGYRDRTSVLGAWETNARHPVERYSARCGLHHGPAIVACRREGGASNTAAQRAPLRMTGGT